MDLFKHVSYKKDSAMFKLLKDTLITENSSDGPSSILSNLSAERLLGKFGDKTLNEISVLIRDLKWDVIYNNLEVTVKVIPAALNFVSFSLILRSYLFKEIRAPLKKKFFFKAHAQ